MANSAAIIGAPTVSDVTEDTNLQVLIAAGLISITDANAGQAAFKTTVISASGNLGALTIAANGSYSYSVADSAVQYLGTGDTKIDTFTVTSVDGTTKKVSFTIHGVNDTAVIGTALTHDVTEDATRPNLTATGSISISDADQGEATFKTSVISSGGNLGNLTLATNGSYSYSVANSAVQYLGAGDTKIDTFTVTSNDGTTKQISFTIHGVNDAAVIGTPTVHDVTEDATNPFLTANGMISITDADQGQAAFKTSVISAAGNLGNLTISANGSYSYSVANSAAQYLGAGDTKVDTFTVTSLDGTTKQVNFTIHGVNDAAVIGTPTVHDVTEDATQPLLYALGTISISDADQGEAAFQLGIISGAGALGTLVLMPNGAYAYVVAESAVQYLGANDTKVDTFTIKSVDGTTKQISFTIHGTNDVAAIGAPTVHDVTEDSNPTTLTATGSISISDADQGQGAFQAGIISGTGNLGTLTLAANGSYSYSVADSATQYLGAGDTKTDTFTVASVDGTTKQVSFTIHGINDAAVIGTPNVHDVTADPSLVTLTATGLISISDVDQGQAFFKTAVTSASGNLGHLTLASNGSYSYTVAESAAAQLGAGGTRVDTFTVTSLDGTTKQVTFTVHGASATNHAAIIGDPTVQDVTEDTSINGAGNLTAIGNISISDPDAGQGVFQSAAGATGNLGSLALSSNGNYTYTVANSAVQYLGATDTKVDTFTVTSVDGTSKQVSFTIHGTNDAAVITGTSTVNLTETDAVLNASGALTATDVDGSAAFNALSNVAGNHGYGHFAITTAGAWTYSTDTAHNEFVGGQTYTDSFTVTTADGTPQVVTVSILGTNDAAVITGTSAVNLTETDAILSASGALSATDVDGSAAFNAQSSVAGNHGYGHFSITAAGAWTYSTDTAHNEFVGGQTYTDSVTFTTADGTPQVVTVNILGTNDAAVIGQPSVADVTEDVSINGSGNLTASGSVSISDVDSAASFQAGATGAAGNLGSLAFAADGTYTYTVADSLTQSLGANDTKTDTFTITAADGTTTQVNFNIHGAQDAPTLTVGTSVTGVDNADILLTISAGLIDTSNALTIAVKNVPSGYTLNHGTLSDDGSTWSLTKADLNGLALQPVGGIAKPGDFSLHIVASSADGTHTASTSADIAVTVTANSHEFSGLALDGYVAGATVFADANGNGLLDFDPNTNKMEVSTTTAADGSFTLSGGSGSLVMFGGTDISTNLSFNGVLKAPEGSTVVTPLTTLIVAITTASAMTDHPISAADAAIQVSAAFGLHAGTDLTTFDPVSAAVSDDPAASAIGSAILSAGIQVQSTVAQVSAVGGSADSVFTAIANTVTTSAASSTTVDLSASSTVDDIVSNSGVSTEAAAAVSAVVSAANSSIQLAGADVTALAQAAVVAQGAATMQLANTDFTDTAQVDALHQTYVTDLGTQVFNAVVGVTGLALVGTLGADVMTGDVGNDALDGSDGNDIISGGGGNDQLYGGTGNDTLTGGAGDDRIDGGAGSDRAIYSDATGGVTIDLTAGTASGAGVGSDTLTSIEAVTGSNFADTFSAVGFTGSSGIAGRPIGLDDFEGKGGDDIIHGTVNASGQILTRISYVSAAAAVTVDIAAGTAHGTAAGDAANVGNDTFTNVNAVIGSAYDDTLLGSSNPNGTYEQYDGRAGNDLIDGRGGYDFAVYNNDATTTSGITVHLAAGTVTGDATVGTDTLRSVEAIRGTNFADVYDATGFNGTTSTNLGSNGTFNNFDGQGGNDTIIGNGNTRIQYSNSAAAVTVDIAAGTAHGTAAGDVAQVGTDTFSGVNAVMGSMFDDTLLGSNSTATETFMGLAGNDFIDGRGGFDVALYSNLTYTTGAISVNMASGTVTGDASTGTDTLRSVEGVQGTIFNDTYVATNFGAAGFVNPATNNVGNNGTFNQFEGLAGNDSITGNGNTRVIYSSAGGGVTINLQAGTANGDASVGTDSYVGVNSATGSNFNDTYNAAGFTGITSAGSFGTFNLFEGLGGNDTITGNGNTRIAYSQAAAAVTVDLSAGTAHGTAAGDVANVGTDTITGGVNSVQGSAFGDSLIGNGNSNIFTGGGGNDTIDGGGSGDIAIFSGTRAQYNISTVAGVTTVSDTVAGRDGTDTLTNVEVLQFTNANVLIASGTLANPVDLSDSRLFFNAASNPLSSLATSSNNDYVKINQGLSGHLIDLGAGTDDTVVLGTGGFYSLNLVNVENLVGSAGNDTASFTTNLNGLNVDLGGGTGDFVNLANGANTLSVTNVENINATDFSGAASNDTLTLSNNVSGLSVNLAQGTNTLNLAAGANSFLNISSVDTVNGTASDDTLTIASGAFTPNNDLSIDLGGGNDTLQLGQTFFNAALHNVEHMVGSTGDDFYTLTNSQNGLAADLGAGNNSLQIAAGTNTLSLTNVQSVGTSDFFNGSPASDDTLTLLNDVTGVTINLQEGNNTLNLAAGTNALTVYNIQTINGSGSSDSLTVQNSNYGVTIDLGAGTDTLTLADGSNGVTVKNIENVVGGNGNDNITIADLTGTVTVTGGLGNDFISLGGSHDNIRFTQVADSATGGGMDNVSNFDVANDAFVFDHVGGLASGIHFVSSGILDGTPGNPQSEAILNGNLLQIDVDGDGQIGAGDMEVYINGINGALTDANFITTGVDHRPTDIQLSGATVAENSNVGSVVGALSATDPDAGDPATFSLTDSAGGLFAISGNNLVVNGPINYEAAQSLQVTVRVTDGGGLSYDKNFTIGVTDVNEAPTAVVLSTPVGMTVENGGDVKVADIAITDDALGTNTLSLSGADAASFSIVTGANGPELHFVGGANFEAKSAYDVTVNANDASASNHVAPDASQSFHLMITDVNEAPAITSGATASVAENAPTSTVVYQALASDPDNIPPNNMITWSLSGTDAAAFSISPTGQVTLNSSANYEAKSSYSINVVATDGGALSVSKAVTIGIIDVNEAPTAVVLSGQVTSTAENGGDVKVADIAVTDDALGSNTLSLSGADAAAFSIVTGAGGKELHFNGGANFEAKTSYDVTVNVNDATASNHVAPDASQNFHLAITNLNEAPTDISLSNNTIGQSTANGTVIGVLSAIDPDAGDTSSFSLISNPGNQFGISGGNLVVTGPLTGGAQQIVVRDTDSGGLTFDKTLTINVTAGATIVGDNNNNTLVGTAGDDLIQALGGNDKLQGMAGNDTLDGGQGFDRAIYTDATSGITVNLAAGTVTGGSGSDTLINVESIVGSDFADTINTAGFTGDSGIAGNPLGLNEIEGRGGDDIITSDVNSQGAPETRISYVSAAAAVTVDLLAGTAHGTAAGDLAQVGNDTLLGSGFSTVIGSGFNDSLLGSNNGAGTVEIFDGRAGDDTLNGRGGFDRADYNLDPATTSGITVNMAAGTVVGDRQGLGDTTIGSDTLISIESVRGTNFADSYNAAGFNGGGVNPGSNGTFNEFNGMGGNDTIVGNNNTRLAFVNATGGVTVDIQAGTATGDTSTGSDTFSGVNAVMGSMYDDTIRGSNSTTVNETFTGLGGNDFIDGRGGFDIASYNNIYFSTGPVTVNMGAGTATGDASIGSDTLRSIESIQGTNFNDVYDASTFGTNTALNIGNNGTFNQFEGLGGNDTVTGNGATRISYASATTGVTVNMAAGTATGDASIGTDTFTGVNNVFGSAGADTYVATGFIGGVGAFNSGNFNLFEGLGGNDTITGNGNTRVGYTQAAAAVTVDLSLGTAHSTAGGDVATVGTDTITGGVNSVQGSNFNDTLIGSAANESFFGGSGIDAINAGGGNDQITGQAGNDTIDGGAGSDIAIYTGPMSAYTLTSPAAGQTQVADSTSTRDGTDILTNVEVLEFSDAAILLSSGSSANPIDISTVNLNPNISVTGTGNDDFLAVGGNIFGHQIDLGAGNDTVDLASAGFYTLNLLHVENLVGSGGDDNVNLTTIAAGLSVDLGFGNDNLSLATGVNTLTVNNVENINSSDFSGTASNDTLNLSNDVSGLTVNLAQGNNTLNLAAGSNSFVNIFNVQHINGTASDDILTITNGVFEPGNNPTIDLGAGNNTLHLGGGGTLTLLNVQHLTADGSDGSVTLNNDVTGLSVDLGAGNDHLSLANGTNSLSIANVENINGSDFSGPASDDALTLLNTVGGGLTIDLGPGSNTLNLAAGNNTFDNLYNFAHINGTLSDDTLTIQGNTASTTIDLGDGNDTLNLNGGSFGLTVANAETINGGVNFDTITISNAVTGSTTITAGAGADNITASAGQDNFRFASVADSTINGQNDTITNFDAAHDTFTFAGITVAGGSIDYVGAGAFEIGHASAVLQNFGPGNDVLNIDIDGNGVMDSADMVVNLTNLTGTLHASNFLLA
jgi:VCBS repeat-containing protein